MIQNTAYSPLGSLGHNSEASLGSENRIPGPYIIHSMAEYPTRQKLIVPIVGNGGVPVRPPPAACVFVGHLPCRPVDELYQELQALFTKWGLVISLKVISGEGFGSEDDSGTDEGNHSYQSRRDSQQITKRPYAFVQYTTPSEASAAVAATSRTAVIGTTILKTELAKVNRTLFLEPARKYGNVLSQFEIHELLAGFGALEEVNWLLYRGFGCWFARFVYRSDAANAYRALSKAPSPQSPGLGSGISVSWVRNLQPHEIAATSAFTAVDRPVISWTGPSFDPCKLFVSNIPPSTSEEELAAMFSTFGVVSHVQLAPAGRKSIYAFVHFGDADKASRAVECTDQTVYEGRKLVVKISRSQDPPTVVIPVPARAPIMTQRLHPQSPDRLAGRPTTHIGPSLNFEDIMSSVSRVGIQAGPNIVQLVHKSEEPLH